jgi:hypothetical protein
MQEEATPTTRTTVWTTYHFSEQEFKDKLGIRDPRHILSVHVGTRGPVEVTMSGNEELT